MNGSFLCDDEAAMEVMNDHAALTLWLLDAWLDAFKADERLGSPDERDQFIAVLEKECPPQLRPTFDEVVTVWRAGMHLS